MSDTNRPPAQPLANPSNWENAAKMQDLFRHIWALVLVLKPQASLADLSRLMDAVEAFFSK